VMVAVIARVHPHSRFWQRPDAGDAGTSRRAAARDARPFRRIGVFRIPRIFAIALAFR
jgi:hypothetical protein